MPFASTPIILVIDDGPHIRRFVHAVLEEEDCEVHEANRVERGLIEAGTCQLDVVILDLDPPDGDDMQLIRELRTWTGVPMLVLSVRVDECNRIEALDTGVDDYLAKPFGVDELVACPRALSRQHTKHGEDGGNATRFGGVEVGLACRLVNRSDEAVHLAPIEYRLLVVLPGCHGTVVTHRELLREVWDPIHSDSSHYLRIYMGHLRRKLERDSARPGHLLTKVGVGYRSTT